MEKEPIERVDVLTSFRGVAAIFVALYHCQIMVPGFDIRGATNLFTKGYLGVDFFFILSGFTLGYVYNKTFLTQISYKKFILYRFARIWPVHFFTLILALILIISSQRWGESAQPLHNFKSFLAHTLMVHSWVLFDPASFNFASWSVSSEWFAYILFPVFLWFSKKMQFPGSRHWYSCIMFAGAVGHYDPIEKALPRLNLLP